MKKTKFWSLLALCFSLAGAVTLTACGDDDDNNTPTPPNNPDIPAATLTGTWNSVHQGEEGTSYTDAITLNGDGTFEEHVTEVDLEYWTHELVSGEDLWKGTYSVKDGEYQVQVTEHWRKGADATELTQETEFEGEAFSLTFEKYGNGYVAMSRLSGGVQFYTQDGEARQMPSLANHELLGRWEYRSRETGTTTMEMVDFYEFKANGTVEYGTYMHNFVDDFDAQGSKRKGIYVPMSETLGRSFFGGGRDDLSIPSGAKLFSIVDDGDYMLDQLEPGNFNTNYWKFYAVRFGGHPLQYVIKDGQLHVGMIGMEEEYFYGQPHTKVQ
ncbi:MAG: hypothetical protein IJ064_05020 [Bacteroidaceae bacterium]|nr:hypothetical protein [Bacteroidaceae bacterium]